MTRNSAIAFPIGVLIGIAAAGCDGTRTDTMRTLAEVQAISAQKDSLLRDVTATTAFIAEVSRQLNTVRYTRSGRTLANRSDLEDNLTPDQRRQRITEQVREITERVALAENRLAVARRRITELTGSDAEKSARLAAFDSTITSFRDIIENQKVQISSLTEQLAAAQAENVQLRADNVQLASDRTMLSSARDSLTTDRNTVYYVIGDRKSLLERRVIERSGGFLGLGATAVVARDLDRNAFTAIDRSRITEIPLPDPEKHYTIVSRHSVAALEPVPEKGGRIAGALRIRDSEAFWAASKFLIVVER